MNQQANSFSKKTLKDIFKITLVVVFLALASSVNFVSKETPLLYESISAAFAFLGMLVIPVFLITKAQKKKLSSFGWRLPVDFRKAALYTGLVFLIMLPAMLVFGDTPAFQDFYISRGLSSDNFVLMVLVIPLLYFFSEEFLFRGFFFFYVFKKIGAHAFWIISLVFAFLHLTKPMPEVFFSFFAGILLCYLSYKTKSFLPAFAVHFLISVLVNGLIVFG